MAARLARTDDVSELPLAVIQTRFWYLDEHPAHGAELAHHRLAGAIMLSTRIRPFQVVTRQVLTLLGDEDYRTADLEGAILKGVATMDMFRDVKGRGATIRNHCAAVGAIARTLADEWHLRSGDQLFLIGLFHDIGKLLCLRAGIESYDGLPGDSLDAPDRLHLVERDRLGFDHAVLGAHVLSSWKIPEMICQIVAWHHQPERAYADGGTVGLQVALLRLADRLEYRLRHDSAPNEGVIEELSASPDAKHVGFGVADLRRAWPQMIDSRDEALALFR